MSSEKNSYYLTTTLPYVNASPHMGHALEFVQADAQVRTWRALGHDVFFNMGADEHGQKIARIADKAGEDRQAYVDRYAGEFSKLIDALELSPDAFIRTTNPLHKLAAQEMWRRCDSAGDIYKKKYTGLYCVGCEAFKTESDLVDGLCPDHQVAPEVIEEENYFFRLSKYQSYLELYLSKEGVILPEWRRHEALEFVKQGLEDVSISREKKRMDWGIDVPNDSEHTMYVWFDALTNYISTLGWPEDKENNFKTFWEEGTVIQFAGKDQVRFQSVLWQAMLKSADVKGSDVVVYHGFINSDGHKMSKSLGNVIDPYALVEKYGTDATRYIMLRHVHPFDDSDLTWEKMDEYYTANLVNGLGNVVARVMKMSESYLEKGEFALASPAELDVPEILNPQSAMDHIWAKVGQIDQIIADTEPFKLIKTDEESAKNILRDLRERLLHIGRILSPFMPATADIIRNAVLENKKPENLFKRLDN